MSSNVTANPSSILPTTFIIPEDKSELNLMLYRYFNALALAINSKDSGIFDSLESLTGGQFFPIFSSTSSSSANYREIFRKVIDFGSLPNTATKSVAHGIAFSSSFSLVRLYGAATDPSNSFIPIPYSSPTLADNIELNLDATNVNVITGSNRSNYTRSFIVMEWVTTT